MESLEAGNYTEKVRTWISPPDPSTNFNKALVQRQQGSGQWFLKGEAYKAWKIERNSFLWLNGIPGCGKTILSSTIIEDLESNEAYSQTLLYFYFDFNDIDKQSLESAVRSLISQLYYKRKDTRQPVDSLYSSCESGKRQPSAESLREIFLSMVQQAGQAWIVLDALDECKTRSDYPVMGLLSWIRQLRDSEVDVHILVTSRPEQDIQSSIKKWTSSKDAIPLQSNLVEDDIRKYIHARVSQLDRWQSKPDIQKKIESSLINKAGGM